MRLPSRSDTAPLTEWSLGMDEGLPRLWRGFMTARILVALVLLLLMVFLHATSTAPLSSEMMLCAVYLALTVWVRLTGKPERPVQRFDPQWLVTVGADVVVFTTLLHWQVSAVNFTPLFALPVLLAAVLGPLMLALATAATVTLALLADTWWLSITSYGDVTSRYLQAALTGLGLFVVAYLANQLALRLARQERLVRSSALAARTQTQVNQLVIDTLSDGVLVIDSNGVVRTANPAARFILGPRSALKSAASGAAEPDLVLPQAPFVLAAQTAWLPLVDVANHTLQLGRAQQTEVALVDAQGAVQRVSVRTQMVSDYSGADASDGLCVMFLEDLREMEARMRTEKLAAMGRMSAAVAHEIRNPLAAITQANALLAEDTLLPAQQQLTSMVQHNAQRLARIVDDVLDISRAAPAASSAVLLPEAEQVIASICRDWAAQNQCADLLWLSWPASTEQASCLVFEEDHLRRVLVNLLDNALRYAHKRTASICVTLRHDDDAVDSLLRLSVWSDAPPLDKSVERHLFEPFFSSESRSSGLGLYICRELCSRHGATIGYQRSDQATIAGNEFFVVFKVAGAMLSTVPAAL
jgi:two-component system, NtrC family, sensor histidine kinase PilS